MFVQLRASVYAYNLSACHVHVTGTHNCRGNILFILGTGV